MSLEIKNLTIADSDNGKIIVDSISMSTSDKGVLALVGPNGSGKSTLVSAIMGHPKFKITSGEIFLNGENITALNPEDKAKKGLFLSPQHSPAIPGVGSAHFARLAAESVSGKKIPPLKFFQDFKSIMSARGLGSEFATRDLNVGFSGGEKKRFELSLIELLRPKCAMLDEPDSGLDVDATKLLLSDIIKLHSEKVHFLLISHHPEILRKLPIGEVIVLKSGKIVSRGKEELIVEIEKNGYENF